VSKDIRKLIRKMSRENPLWGASRIHGELLKVGIDIGETSVSKYMVHGFDPMQTARPRYIRSTRLKSSAPPNFREGQVEDMGVGGGMVAALKNRQKRKTREFRQTSEEGLGSADAAKLWVHALHRPPRKPILPVRRYRGHRRILLTKGKASKPTHPRSRCSSTGRRHQVA
jgi:hypothetical protein